MRNSVLRCVWLAAVALSATGATACGGDEGPPHVAPGAPVGKVVEVTGEVTATRAGKTRALAAGEDVSSDDIVATTGSGSVSIELFHNRANLQLQNGASSRIDDSLAWELTKSEVAKLPGSKVMVSAGRHGEHQAADSVNTIADSELQRRPASTAAPGAGAGSGRAVAPAADPVLEPLAAQDDRKVGRTGAKKKMDPAKDTGHVQERSGGEKDFKKSPPKSPEPNTGSPTPTPTPTRDEESGTDRLGDSTRSDDREREATEASAATILGTRVEALRGDLARCLEGSLEHVTITVTVSAGKLTFGFAKGGAEAARSCVKGVLKKVDVKGADGTTTIEIDRGNP